MTLVLATISVVCACYYGLYLVRQEISLRRTIVKTIPVSSLALLSVTGGGPMLLTLALGLGALGDAFLSRDGERNFLVGLCAFLFGHLAYIILLFEIGDGIALTLSQPWRIVTCVALVLLAGWVVQQLLPHLGALKIPVLVYVVMILLMGAAALSLPLSWPLGFAIVGALFFITSDAILAFEVFVFGPTDPRHRWTAPLLWFLYWGGQCLILMAVLKY